MKNLGGVSVKHLEAFERIRAEKVAKQGVTRRKETKIRKIVRLTVKRFGDSRYTVPVFHQWTDVEGVVRFVLGKK